MIRLTPRRKDTAAAWLFLSPGLAGFLIFFGIPFAACFYYSLMNRPVNGEFAGMDNYLTLLSSPVFRKAAWNTLIFTGFSLPLILLLSLLLALLLNRPLAARHWFRASFVAPLVVPVASVALFWQTLFDPLGVMNGWRVDLGRDPVDWLDSVHARSVVILLFVWKNVGYNMVLFLAGLQQIPREYHEAASVDGAGPVRRFFGITLVYLAPTAFFVVVISIVNSFKVFRETYLLAGEYPHDSIYMLQHYMNNLFTSLDLQKLTSAALLMAMLFVVLVLVLFAVERRLSRWVG